MGLMMKMKGSQWTATGLIAATLAIAGALPGIAVAAGNSGADHTGQKIYIDPDTGEVIDSPRQTKPQARQRATDTGKASGTDKSKAPQKRNGPKAWKTPDGTQMLAPDPDSAPSEQVIRCPDGSLRMGHAKPTNGESARAALCAQAIR